MERNNFIVHIDLIITDSAIKVCESSHFTTFTYFFEYINLMVTTEDYESINNFIVTISNDLTFIVGIDIIEAFGYVRAYFYNKKWDIYYKPIRLVIEEFDYYIL